MEDSLGKIVCKNCVNLNKPYYFKFSKACPPENLNCSINTFFHFYFYKSAYIYLVYHEVATIFLDYIEKVTCFGREIKSRGGKI